MKKTIMILAVMVIMFSGLFGAGYDEYNDRNLDVEYGNEYGHGDDCEYSHDGNGYAYRQMDDYMALQHYNGRVFYYAHPTADIFFTLIGRQVYIVPGFKFRRSMHRSNFYAVPKADFIYYSCGSMDYYDSYMRFGFFNDYYYNNPWSYRRHRHVCSDYYGYYGNRRNSRSYYRLQRKVMRGYRRLERKHRHSDHYGYVKRSGSRHSLEAKDSRRGRRGYSKGRVNYKSRRRVAVSERTHKPTYRKERREKRSYGVTKRQYRSDRKHTALPRKSGERFQDKVKRVKRNLFINPPRSQRAVKRSKRSYKSDRGSQKRSAKRSYKSDRSSQKRSAKRSYKSDRGSQKRSAKRSYKSNKSSSRKSVVSRKSGRRTAKR
ncbi:MAG: hypothetical protein GY765_39030 [bacterium]|nr:hypothetical protein [bacterium]